MARISTQLGGSRAIVAAGVLLAAVALLRPLAAQGGGAAGGPASIPACPNAAPGTEVRGGADSTARRAPAAGDTMARAASVQRGAPDIILRASVSARELRFASQPHVSIRLCGGTLDSVRVIERRNLPSPVVAGTTYRDVYVAIEILGHLTGSCIDSVARGRTGAAANSVCASLDSAGVRRAAPAPRRPPP